MTRTCRSKVILLESPNFEIDQNTTPSKHIYEMSVKINSESLYDGLPEKTKEELHLMPLGMPASLSIESFINEATPDDIEKHLESLRNKPLMLDKYRKQNIKRRSRAIGLSAKEKRELGLYKIPKEKQRYESFVPLHKLWTDYMKTLIGIYAARSNITLKTVENKLLKADYHGAFLEVASSKCRTYLNTMGIVIKETKNMFYIITEEDKVKGIPKLNSVFQFSLDDYIFEIFGNNFRFRAGERCARKFKTKPFLSF